MNDFFDYFQVLAMAFFLLVFVGRILYLRSAKGINPVSLGVGKKGVQTAVELLFFVGLTLWIIEVLLYSLDSDFRLFPSPLDAELIDATPAKTVGAAVVIVGIVIFALALIAFGNSWRVGIDEKAPGELITNGIFAVSRNPIFVFLDLYFLGTFLIDGTVIFAIFAVIVTLGMHYQILREERFLTRTYGEAYEVYRANAGRYFTWTRK
jgi:protein-S-isoprenylcysteine O-methyltransferase Ste14